MARVTVFVGRFGSGKTEVSLNYTLRLAKAGEQVALADLDVVTPYFRSRDAAAVLAAAGIELIAPRTFGRYSEPVALNPAILGAVDRPDCRLVIDVGGEDHGAKVLGVYRERLVGVGYEMLFVANPYRPGMGSAEAIAAAVAEIEAVARLRVTSLVSNPHLMEHTTSAIVRAGHEAVQEASRRTGLPIKLLCYDPSLAESPEADCLTCDVLPLKRHFLPLWDERFGDSVELSPDVEGDR